jgi:hypothetical protein
MARLIINAEMVHIEAFLALMAAMEGSFRAAAPKNESGEPTVEFPVSVEFVPDEVIAIKERPTKRDQARVQYVALSPENAPEALQALGEHTIIGIVFQDVVAATKDGRVITARDIKEKRHFNSKSVERSLVQLRQGGLVVSQPIVHGND